MKKKKNGYSLFVILVFISVVIACVGCFVILRSFSFFEKDLNTLYTKRHLSYQVKTKDNKYYDKEVLGEQKSFIAPALKTIIPHFLVEVKSNDNEYIKYSYDITGVLNAYVDGKTIKSKKYPLASKKNITLEEVRMANIEEEIEIDYEYYKEECEKIKKETASIPQCVLTLEMKLNSSNQYENKEDITIFKIPITKQNKKISLEKRYPNTKKGFLPKLNIKLANKDNLIGGIFIILGSLILFIVSFVSIKRRKEIKNIRKRIKKLKMSNNVKR